MTQEQTKKEPQTLVSIGLPHEIKDKIDEMRGDISRSLYLRKRIIAMVNAEIQGEN